MSVLSFLREQFQTLPILANESTCSGKTYVITGANSGLGLEAAKHLASFSAARIVLAVRNPKAGEEAKRQVEAAAAAAGRPEGGLAVEVWHVDMAVTSSVCAFARRVATDLDRIDGFLANGREATRIRVRSWVRLVLPWRLLATRREVYCGFGEVDGLVQERRDDVDRGGQEQRRTIRFRPRDGVGADHTTGAAGPVVDVKILAERFVEFLGDDARDAIH